MSPDYKARMEACPSHPDGHLRRIFMLPSVGPRLPVLLPVHFLGCGLNSPIDGSPLTGASIRCDGWRSRSQVLPPRAYGGGRGMHRYDPGLMVENRSYAGVTAEPDGL